jgi:putative DNA primase/helicase
VTKAIDSKYELAQFNGKRLVTTVEPRKAGHLDEEVLKQMTGGDLIRARDIYKKDIVYYPEFKLWMAMNNQPRIIGTDEGIWRRVRMIPFKVRIPEARKIRDLASILVAEEGPGILNRFVAGALAWQEESLQLSGAVKKATREFRSSQNVIQRFFDGYTVTGRNDLHARAGALYSAYCTWAKTENEYLMRSNEFAIELETRGFTRRTGHANIVEWWGIGLKADAVGAG